MLSVEEDQQTWLLGFSGDIFFRAIRIGIESLEVGYEYLSHVPHIEKLHDSEK